MLGQREAGALDIRINVVLADLLFIAVAPDVVCDVAPGTEAVCLGALKEGELLVGAPVVREDRDRVLLLYLVGVRARVVVVARFAGGEAGDAEVVFVAGVVSAAYADLGSIVLAWVGTYRWGGK